MQMEFTNLETLNTWLDMQVYEDLADKVEATGETGFMLTLPNGQIVGLVGSRDTVFVGTGERNNLCEDLDGIRAVILDAASWED